MACASQLVRALARCRPRYRTWRDPLSVTTNRRISATSASTFAGHPDQWRLLGERPELAPQAAEEVMRWAPSVPTVFRFAVEDIDLHDVHLPAGTFVLLCTHAASRDPRVFRDGERFDITVPREAPHLIFGGGPHYIPSSGVASAGLLHDLQTSR